MQVPADVTAQPTTEPAVPVPDVRGLVDNGSPNRLYGWAFDAARPGYRLMVELRLGGERIAGAVADLPRPDLAKNGVGDGCHAFEFEITQDQWARHAEFSVIAMTANGEPVPLPVRLPAHQLPKAAPKAAAAAPAPAGTAELLSLRQDLNALAGRLAKLPDPATLHAVAAQQAEMAKQVRAGVLALDQRLARLPEIEVIQQLAVQQGLVAERLQALEVWLSQLDRRLVDTVAPAAAPAPAVNRWQLVLFGSLGFSLVIAVGMGLILGMR